MAKKTESDSELSLPIETERMARLSMAKQETAGKDGKPQKGKRKRMSPEERAEWRAERDKAQATEESLVWAEIRENAKREGEKNKRKRAGMLHGHVKYNRDALMPLILDRMANGESLANICRDEGMPPVSTVLTWSTKERSFAEAYNRARETMADVLFDQCLAIADDASKDIVHNATTGEVTVNHAAIARAKLRIDTRFRIAGKISAKYADKGPADGAAVTVNNLTINARDMEPEQREKLRNLLLVARANGAS